MKALLLSITTLFLFITHLNAQPGAPDPTFGTNGLVHVNSLGTIYSMLVTNEGKTLLSGPQGLYRMNADGSPDNAFGTNGLIATSSPILDIALQADGKIVALEAIDLNNYALLRFGSTGALDNTFGAGGVQDVHTHFLASASSVCVLANGQILVGSYESGQYNLVKSVVQKFNSNGSPDHTFGTTDTIRLDIHFLNPGTLLQQPDGSVLAGGFHRNPVNGRQDLAVVKFSTAGILDKTYGTDGIAVHEVSAVDFIPENMVLQPDGKLLIVSSYIYVTREITDLSLTRLNTDGSLDGSFASNGMLVKDFSGGGYDDFFTVSIAPDGKILTAGISNYDGNITIASFNPDGTTDLTFADNGIQKTYAGTQQVLPTITTVFNGKLYVGVGSWSSDYAAVARYVLDGFSVSITDPKPNAVITGPANITLSASVNSPNSAVNNVKFYNGSTLLYTDNTAPYSYNWQNIPTGNYTIKAIATNSAGETATSPAQNFTVEQDLPPTVSIISPTANAVFNQPTTINIAVNAVDGNADGTIASVEYFANGNSLGSVTSPPFTFTWANPAIGEYSLTARATSNTGQKTTSAPVPVSVVKGQPPVVSITSPANDASFRAPANITIDADATDVNSGGSVAKVEFYSGTTLLGTDNVAPFSFSWQNVPQGDYQVTAKAFAANGLSTVSASVHLIVTSPYLPVVSITSPKNGQQFPAPATFNVTAEAVATYPGAKVQRVEFFLGSQLIETQFNYPYTFKVYDLAIGNYSLTAVAFDNTGVSNTQTVNFQVNVNQPPVVSLVNISNNQHFPSNSDLRLTANATDPDGKIKSVEFFANGNPLFTEVNAPYTRIWPNLQVGTYVLTTRATDNTGGVTVSNPITIIVDNNAPPTVNITNPYQGAEYPGPATFRLEANATDPDGKITKVEFYNGNSYVTTEYNYPYSYLWPNVPEGNYNIIAKAYDNSGAFTISQAVQFSVVPNQAPTVMLASPSDNDTYSFGQGVSFLAFANDDGQINRVEFYNGPTLMFTEYNYPYSRTVYGLAPGNYDITARAVDNSGATALSGSVHFTVNDNNSGMFTGSQPPLEYTGQGVLDLSFAPNPVSDILTVEINGMVEGKQTQILIYSISGQLMKVEATAHSISRLNISSLANGTYVLKVVSGKFVISKEFIKQ